MINNLRVEKIEDSWKEFANQYDIKQDSTTYLKQLDMLSRIHNGYCYPQLIIPDEIISRLNQLFIRGMKLKTDNNGIYLQDLISEAKLIEPSFSDIKYLIPPAYPYPPQIEKVPETKTIFVTNNHLGCWGTIIILLLIICVCTAIGTGEIGAGILYSMAFIPVFLLVAHQYGAMKSTREMKTVRLSEIELEQKKKEAKVKYDRQLQQYRESKTTFDTRLEDYNLTQRANMSRIESKMDEILWQINGRLRLKVQETAERATDVPQRGRSENTLFERLMKIMPNYVKIDMKVGRYYPDLCVIIPGVLALDIEVDEPYAFGSKVETHYHGCGDATRNEIFADNGWYILRFSEEQVIVQTDKCVEIIENLVSYVRTGNFFSLQKLYNTMQLMAKPRWSKEQARLMAIRNRRELY